MQQDVPANPRELAVQQTAWASERPRLANERTLVAWLRTGLAVIGFGAIVPRVLDGVKPERLVGFVFLLG